jgi:chromosome segregation protein
MYLKNLEITGFKSFAKKTLLDFSRPITAVVGPNGSGKSNVSEAFRFVLGEQSIKSMRGKKSEDLIWNGGSGQVGRSNRASVKVTFDNAKRVLNLDFDEVTLERVVYRDAVSEYLINGSAVRLKDIIELLANAHIGATGHHIISQGEADHILAANPRERKEIIEDALGLKIYQYKKRESERKLDKTRENIGQVESLRKEIIPHLKFLKKQVERIEKTYALKDELRNLYREYLRREKFYVENALSKIGEDRIGPENKLRQIEKQLEEAKRVLTQTPGIDSKRHQLLEVESKINHVRMKREENGRAIGRLEGELSSIERLAEKAKRDAEAINSAPVPFNKILELKSSIEFELDQTNNLADIEGAKRIFTTIRALVADFVEHYKTKSDVAVSAYDAEIVALSEKKKRLEADAIEIRIQEEKYNKEYVEIKNLIESEKDKSRDAEKNMFQLMAEQKEAYAALSLIKDREGRAALLKDEFEREIREGSMLVGRDVLNYSTLEFLLPDGQPLTKEAALAEDRHVQEERLRAIQKIKVRVEDAGAGGGEDVMKEFKDVNEREAFLGKELADLEQTSAALVNLIKELDGKLELMFRDGVSRINNQFESFFTLMFGGGKASIKVVSEEIATSDSDDEQIAESSISMPESEDTKPRSGIEIDVKLPRKNIKGLEMLSGGERALTSIALLFAISQVNPPPFIILDETDAALDEANSKKYGDMIENLSKLSQLILITHNRETMSRAGALYGVTMGQDGVSRLLSVAFDEAVAVAK